MSNTPNSYITDETFDFTNGENGEIRFTWNPKSHEIEWVSPKTNLFMTTNYEPIDVRCYITTGLWFVLDTAPELPDEDVGVEDSYIVSNQIRCNTCGTEPYSAYRHDYSSCICGEVAADGGQEYLRRTGKGYEEMSILVDEVYLMDIVSEVQASMDSKRNALGVTLAVLRGLRDTGLHSRKQASGITVWSVKDAK